MRHLGDNNLLANLICVIFLFSCDWIVSTLLYKDMTLTSGKFFNYTKNNLPTDGDNWANLEGMKRIIPLWYIHKSRGRT